MVRDKLEARLQQQGDALAGAGVERFASGLLAHQEKFWLELALDVSSALEEQERAWGQVAMHDPVVPLDRASERDTRAFMSALKNYDPLAHGIYKRVRNSIVDPVLAQWGSNNDNNISRRNVSESWRSVWSPGISLRTASAVMPSTGSDSQSTRPSVIPNAKVSALGVRLFFTGSRNRRVSSWGSAATANTTRAAAEKPIDPRRRWRAFRPGLFDRCITPTTAQKC